MFFNMFMIFKGSESFLGAVLLLPSWLYAVH